MGQGDLSKEGTIVNPGLTLCKKCQQPLQKIRENQLYHKDCKPSYSGRSRNRKNYVPVVDREFRAWDGEGVGTKFILLANSEGEHIASRSGLSTIQCLDFLCRPRGVKADIWFAFGYDVNMILKDLPWQNLQRLSETGRTKWSGYLITYIPRKIFQVSTTEGSFRSYDTFSFFAMSFVKSLMNWNIKVPALITEGKAARAGFDTWDMKRIIAYNDLECTLLCELMDNLRRSILDAGWSVKGWHGPGALANWFLGEHKADTFYKPSKELDTIAAYAYYGGRIDANGWGTAVDVFHYDIVSAYPWAMSYCPKYTKANFKESRSPEDPFSLVKIEWKIKCKALWGPFPFRMKDGSIRWPMEGQGWYWWTEIQAATKRFGSKMVLKIIEGKCFTGTSYFPLSAPISEAFALRLSLKEQNHPANVAIKLGLNSLYGKTAQTQGFQGRKPRFRSLLWAGYLTAKTRARLQEYMDDDVLAVMTDSFFVKHELPAELNALGSLGYEGKDSFSMVEPGFYSFGDHRYTRGFEPSSVGLSVPQIVDKFASGTEAIPFQMSRFVGMKLAMMGGQWPQKWRNFVPMDRSIRNPGMFGTSKREPNMNFCEGWNTLIPYESNGGMSYPYDKKTTDLSLMEDRASEEGEE